jgi:hypothetical protein
MAEYGSKWSRRRAMRMGAALPWLLASPPSCARRPPLPVVSAAPEYAVDIKDFGARGRADGDDTDAFRAMHRHLLDVHGRSPATRFVIRLPRGHYRYRWNEWLWWLSDVTVLGWDATIQCISDSVWDGGKTALVTNENPIPERWGSQTAGSARSKYGALIETAEAATRTVRLLDTNDGSSFHAGALVCVLSYDQQFGGYPPNCRYFEYVRVEAITGEGLVLDRPLRWRHAQDAYEDPEVESSLGRARVVPLDQPGRPFPRCQRLVGLTVAANPHARGRVYNTLQVQAVYETRIESCQLIGLAAGVGHSCDVQDCSIEFVEPDKLLDRLTLTGCRIGRISQATGVEHVRLHRCRVASASDIQARQVEIEESELHGAEEADGTFGLSLDGFTPTRQLTIRNSTFFGRGDRQPGGACGPNRQIQVLLDPAIVIDERGILIRRGDPRATTLVSGVEPGSPIFAGGEFAGTVFCDGRAGRVGTIAVEGDFVRINLDFAARLRHDDTLFAFRTNEIVGTGNRFVNTRSIAPLSASTTWEQQVEHSRIFRFAFQSDAFDQTILQFPGFLEQVVLEVVTAAAPASSGARLILDARTPSYRSLACTFDLTAPGRREVSPRRAIGALGRDLLQPFPPAAFVWDAYAVHEHDQTPDRIRRVASYRLTITTRPPFPS